MPNTIATGSKTIIDLSDGKTLSFYLNTDRPKTQIYDTNSSTYIPNWATNNVHIEPVLYANQTPIEMNDSNITSFTWKMNDTTLNPSSLPSGISIDNTSTTAKYKLTIN